MRSQTTKSFWRLFASLPDAVQSQSRAAYRQWRANPAHPSLRFKRVGTTEPVYSIRIGIRYRALGLLEGDTVTWFWIGDHDDYERMLGG